MQGGYPGQHFWYETDVVYLYCGKGCCQHLLLWLAHAVRNIHVLVSLTCLKAGVMYVELNKAGNLSFFCL